MTDSSPLRRSGTVMTTAQASQPKMVRWSRCILVGILPTISRRFLSSSLPVGRWIMARRTL